MKFDTIIIGGGLSGLVCGLSLLEKGIDCAIISTGQSCLHFCSGAFSFLSEDVNPETGNFTDAVKYLDEEHPYSKIGADKIEKYLSEIPLKFKSWGIPLHGRPYGNSYMISQFGTVKPVWMGFEDSSLFEMKDFSPGKRVVIVNLEGFQDFNHSFIESLCRQKGAETRILDIRIEETVNSRLNMSEIRSVNIAGIMDNDKVLLKLSEIINNNLDGEDTVILPSVFGLESTDAIGILRQNIRSVVMFVATMPPSVPGIRTQMQLKKMFTGSGGTLMEGDKVTESHMEHDKIEFIKTHNLGTDKLQADNYILASGSFISNGLAANPDTIFEPIMNLDVNCKAGRDEWYDRDFFASHNFFGFGVISDNNFKVKKNGRTIDNLYAIGSVLSGYNPIKEGSGAGVAIMTALYVADKIKGL